MIRAIPCAGGLTVEVLETDLWKVPRPYSGARFGHVILDFSRLPRQVRPWWKVVLEAAYRGPESLVQVYNTWATALYFSRFLEESGQLTTALDTLNDVDWGSFATWLSGQHSQHGKPLSHNYRRCQFSWLSMAARYAISLDLPGTSHLTLERLRAVARNHFRGTARHARRRIEQRALTADQYADLYAMLAEEWQRYLDSKQDGAACHELPALVACWIAFTDGVRSSEINTLTVADILPDPAHGKHKLRAHAPNKDPDMVPIDDESLRLLEELVRYSAETRAHLETGRLRDA